MSGADGLGAPQIRWGAQLPPMSRSSAVRRARIVSASADKFWSGDGLERATFCLGGLSAVISYLPEPENGVVFRLS